MAGEAAVQGTEWKTVRIDERVYTLTAEAVRDQNLARFEGKTTFGDFSKDSDDLISSDVLNDFSGGGQVSDRNEGSDQGRFWWATLDTRNPNALTLAREVVAVAGPNTTGAAPLGDLTVGATTTMYGHYGANVVAWDEATGAVGASLATLTDPPVNLAVEFGATGAGSDPVLWIPQGDQGYQTFDGSALSAQDAAVQAVAFCEFDDRLFALCADGTLQEWDGISWSVAAQLDRRHVPLHLVSFYDRSDTPALHAVTSRGVYAFVAIDGRFQPTNLGLPPHPDNGLGAAVWAGGGVSGSLGQSGPGVGGDLYVTAATQTYRYTLGATIAPIGPQRDQGLPPEFRGKIVSLCAEHNGLYALLQGTPALEADEEGVETTDEGPTSGDGQTGGSTAFSCLLVWTGIGWHTAWVSPEQGGTPTRLMVSGAEGAYRLWWGWAGNLYTIDLPTDFHLPRQGLQAGIDRFQLTGQLEEGWFDAQMEGFYKLASHLQVNVEEASAGQPITVEYKTDFDQSWTQLGDAITYPGRRMLSYGFAGLPFFRIKHRWTMSTDDPTLSPLRDSSVLHFTKIPHDAKAWEIPIDLNFEGQRLGRTAGEMRAELEALLVAKRFVRFTIGQEDYRVRVSAAQGQTGVGHDQRGVKILSIVEIVDEEDEAAG